MTRQDQKAQACYDKIIGYFQLSLTGTKILTDLKLNGILVPGF